MAGIGFELRKIFGKKTLVSNVFGVMYASMASVGPSLVFIFLLFTVRLILQYFSATELEKIYFTASFTYAFLIAMLISAFLTSIISRYVSDRIFQGIEADIASSLYGVMILGTVVSGLVAGVLCVFMYRYDHVPLLFCVAYYLLTILATNVYNLISFVSALKEYKKITLSYLCGVILAIILFFVLYKAMDVSIILAIYLSLVGGFILILFALLCMCIKFFGMPNDNLFGFVTYFKKYPKLFLSGILYTLGFYVSNIVYWFTTDMSIQAGIFIIR